MQWQYWKNISGRGAGKMPPWQGGHYVPGRRACQTGRSRKCALLPPKKEMGEEGNQTGRLTLTPFPRG